jgi:hypothetical protein
MFGTQTSQIYGQADVMVSISGVVPEQTEQRKTTEAAHLHGTGPFFR